MISAPSAVLHRQRQAFKARAQECRDV